MQWRVINRSTAFNEAHIAAARENESVRLDLAMQDKQRLDATQLQRQYLKDVFRYVSRRVGDHEQAEDITAETFAAAFAGLPGFRYQCDPKLWLFSIARHNILMELRRKKARPQTQSLEPVEESTMETENPADNPHAALEREEARQTIRKMMSALKEDQCEALRLKYWEDLSINEMAIVMKRSPAAVNSLLQRARQTIFQKGHAYFSDSEVTP
jgi:RNA polymerase sigma-70 factor (ECF subfamily)